MQFDVAIVGCGASGAVAATQLFRQAGRAISVCCIEPSARLGAGLAYGRCGEEHLLNVPASRISAIAGEDFDFVDWLKRRRLLDGEPDALFAPRRVYADYLTDCLGRALRNAEHRHVIDHRDSLATALKPDRTNWRVLLASGEMIEADAVLLALGNLRSSLPPAGLETLAGDRRYMHDPWQLSRDRIKRDRPVAIVGSGLTAVDVVQSLIGGGHRATIDVVSRSGQWPAVHRIGLSGHPVHWPEGSLRRLLVELRRQLDFVASSGGDWRTVIDSLRPHTQRLWQALPEADQRRFRRRLSSAWNRARHRMPPAIHKALTTWQREGRLRLHAAPALRAIPSDREIELELSASTSPLKVRRVINATGPALDLRRCEDSLLNGLFADGRVRPGSLGVGLDADEDGRLIDRAGQTGTRLYALGPLLQGKLFESTAMPEIKVQAYRLASTVLDELEHRGADLETIA